MCMQGMHMQLLSHTTISMYIRQSFTECYLTIHATFSYSAQVNVHTFHFGHYLLHISFSSPARMLFWDPLHYCMTSRSVPVDATDLHADLLLSELHNS